MILYDVWCLDTSIKVKIINKSIKLCCCVIN